MCCEYAEPTVYLEASSLGTGAKKPMERMDRKSPAACLSVICNVESPVACMPEIEVAFPPANSSVPAMSRAYG